MLDHCPCLCLLMDWKHLVLPQMEKALVFALYVVSLFALAQGVCFDGGIYKDDVAGRATYTLTPLPSLNPPEISLRQNVPR